jgi:hypothetical protein
MSVHNGDGVGHTSRPHSGKSEGNGTVANVLITPPTNLSPAAVSLGADGSDTAGYLMPTPSSGVFRSPSHAFDGNKDNAALAAATSHMIHRVGSLSAARDKGGVPAREKSYHLADVATCGACERLEEGQQEALTEDYFGENLRRGNGVVTLMHVSVMLFEFVTQALFPLSTPVVIAVQGLTAAQNKSLAPPPGKFLAWLVQFWYFAVQWTPLTLALVIGEAWTLVVASLCTVVFLYRILTIAGKYGSFTDDHYQWFLTTPDANVFESVLLATWFENIPDAKIDLELEEAQRFAGIHLVDDPQIMFVNGDAVCSLRYLRALLKKTFGTPPPKSHSVLVKIAANMTMLVPLMSYYDRFGFTTPDSTVHYLGIAFTLCSMYSLFSFAPVLLLFLYVGILHHHRKYNVQQALLDAVARTMGAQRVDDRMISLHHGSNIVVWDHIRLVAKHFGRVYSNRISFNTLTAVVLIAALLVFLFVRQVLYGITSFIMLITINYCLVTMFTLAFITIIFAVLTNQVEVLAIETLAHEEMSIRFATHSAMTEVPQNFEVKEYCLALHALRTGVERRLQIDPVNVMYVPARNKIVTAFGALIGLAITFQGIVFIYTYGGSRF